MHRVNVEGTRELMLAAQAAGVERIVYTSSVAVLGIVQGGIADEETPSRAADMIGPYKLSKFEAEAAVRELIETRGLPAVIVNPSTPIGPGDIKPTPTGQADRAGGARPHARLLSIPGSMSRMSMMSRWAICSPRGPARSAAAIFSAARI